MHGPNGDWVAALQQVPLLKEAPRRRNVARVQIRFAWQGDLAFSFACVARGWHCEDGPRGEPPRRCMSKDHNPKRFRGRTT